MGVQFGSQEHEDAIAKVLAACKKAKKTSAIFCASHFLRLLFHRSYFDQPSTGVLISLLIPTSPQPSTSPAVPLPSLNLTKPSPL